MLLLRQTFDEMVVLKICTSFFEAKDSDMKYIYDHFVESSNGSFYEDNYIDEKVTMQALLADAEHVEENVLKFKGSIKGHRVLNDNRGCIQWMLMDDYFAPDALFTPNFRTYF
ncbi:putative glutathione S-transferase GSTU6 [Hordeum vulgare]|nr:putative glutathione S-transferase GSTU6 [Hordeum vulgare]